jgi:cupin fold WbuC family metalloprotein
MTTPSVCSTDERSKRRGKVHFALQGGGNAKRNILKPGTVMPIHRHLASSETVVLLRGRICWHFYDDAGHETESVVLDANGDIRCINVEKAPLALVGMLGKRFCFVGVQDKKKVVLLQPFQ